MSAGRAHSAVAVLAALGLVLTGSAGAAEPPRAADLEAKLVCPVCETTLDQSNAPVAERMKLFIRERIAAGDSEEQIVDALVAEFGEGVVASPPDGGFGLLAWLLPLVAVAVGAVAVWVAARAWTRARPAAAGGRPLDPELERRVDDALARFDG